MKDKYTSIELQDLAALEPLVQLGDIVLVDQATNHDVLSLCSQNGVKHVVQKSNLKSNSEIEFSNSALASPSEFFQFPLSCIFGVENPGSDNEAALSKISVVVGRLSDRRSILDQITVFVQELTASLTLLNDILSVVDEALTNAVYNAPFAARHLNSPSREGLEILIDPAKRPLVFASHDGDRIIVGCRDSYGSLNVSELINRIKRCYEMDLGSVINFGEGGAGIGSFLMFNSCSSMYIGVDKEVSTTICCAFPFKLSATQRNELPKNLHLIHR